MQLKLKDEECKQKDMELRQKEMELKQKDIELKLKDEERKQKREETKSILLYTDGSFQSHNISRSRFDILSTKTNVLIKPVGKHYQIGKSIQSFDRIIEGES